MSISFWHRGTGLPDVRADVAVVGGGIIGSSTSYWLRRLLPASRIVLLDAGTLANGASGRNAGFILQGAASDFMKDCRLFGVEKARALWHFTRENRELIASELDPSVIALDAAGSMVVAGSKEEDERLCAAAEAFRQEQVDAVYLDAVQTNRGLSSRGFYGSLTVSSGAAVHPVRLVREIAARSEAEVLEHHRVESIEASAGGVVLETPRRRVHAERMVVSVNAWLPRLFPSLAPFVRPVRAQMLATAPTEKRWLKTPVYSHDGYYYVRQTTEGSLLAGGARHLHEADEVGFDDYVTQPVQRSIEEYLHTHFPMAAAAPVVRRWSGTMGFSPDGLPVAGELPGLAGSYWAAGFTGHGMGYGFRFGKLMAELLAGDPDPDGLSLFSETRFS